MTAPEYTEQASMAARTTLAVGGPARRIARVADLDALLRALEENAGAETRVLGGGSNLLVADRGFEGLLLQPVDTSQHYDPATGELQIAAGAPWDAVVARTVEAGAAGIECLSGIPGNAGAAPVQNIGAYGQELSGVLVAVDAVDLGTGQPRRLEAKDCGLGYRSSRFKGSEAGKWCITGLHLQLEPGGEATPRYGELTEALDGDTSLARVREEILRLRRRKSMVADPDDENRRSAGSFFTNPVVETSLAEALGSHHGNELPCWPTEDGRTRLAAAWLIEQSGFTRGYRHGAAGLSTAHVLALINRGEAKAADLLELATLIRDRVLENFGVRLVPEPVPLGFHLEETADLWGDQPTP